MESLIKLVRRITHPYILGSLHFQKHTHTHTHTHTYTVKTNTLFLIKKIVATDYKQYY